ncbi:hypothetical protein [Kordiimonas sp.]
MNSDEREIRRKLRVLERAAGPNRSGNGMMAFPRETDQKFTHHRYD